MGHESSLIVNVTLGLVAAFVGGFLATKLRLPPILGYLLAGVAIGPFTPGIVGDAKIAAELAEIGVILLMFGVGVHFSLRDLLAVRGIAVPGALAQVAVTSGLGLVLARSWGWSPGAALVFGLAVSIASTVVLLRTLMERDVLDTIHGRIAVGWLIVQDLFIVLVLVLLPALPAALGSETNAVMATGVGEGNVFVTLGLALGKTALFMLLMLFVGARAVPWLLVQVARGGSREMFTLAVLAVALGIAVGAAALLGVSLALGAFLAGLVVGESDLSHQAAADAVPLRDAFAVLFFLSVGMLFDPSFLLTSLGRVMAALSVIMLGTPVAAFLIVGVLGYPLRTALTVAAGLAQIGEFSFIVAGLGRTLGVLPEAGYQLILSGALLSITLNPLMFRLIDPVEAWLRRHPKVILLLEGRAARDARMLAVREGSKFHDHAIICGYGRVGNLVGRLLERQGFPYVVIEQNQRLVEELRRRDVAAFYGDAANKALLTHINLGRARVLVIAIPDPRATRLIVEYARRMNPDLEIIARTHSEREWVYLRERVSEAVLGEREAALEMARYTLRRFGVSDHDIPEIVQDLQGWVELGDRTGHFLFQSEGDEMRRPPLDADGSRMAPRSHGTAFASPLALTLVVAVGIALVVWAIHAATVPARRMEREPRALGPVTK